MRQLTSTSFRSWLGLCLLLTLQSGAGADSILGRETMVKGPGGQEARLFLPSKPPQGSMNLLIALHGEGGSGGEMFKEWSLLADELSCLLLCPQGPQRLDVGYSWGSEPEAIGTLLYRFMREVGKRHKIRLDQVILAGFGEGATMATEIALRNPDLYRGVIAIASDFVKEHWTEPPYPGTAVRLCILIGTDAESYARLVEGKQFFREWMIPYFFKEFTELGFAEPDNARTHYKKAYEWITEGMNSKGTEQ